MRTLLAAILFATATANAATQTTDVRARFAIPTAAFTFGVRYDNGEETTIPVPADTGMLVVVNTGTIVTLRKISEP
jgi:hypothetical protein